MFTLRVIFVGLIAFLSNDSGTGFTVVLIDDGVAEAQTGHKAYALLLEGSCESGAAACTPVNLLPNYENHGFVPQLQWPLSGMSARIDGYATAGSTLSTVAGRPAGPSLPEELPNEQSEIADWSWLPSLGDLTGGQEPHPSCFAGDPGQCPVEARFLIASGVLSACHLVHDVVVRVGDPRVSFLPNSGETCEHLARRSTMVGAERVQLFHLPDGSNQALADAVVMEQRINAPFVVLRAWPHADLPGSPGPPDPPARMARLEPVDGVVTLAVLNVPAFNAVEKAEKLRAVASRVTTALDGGVAGTAFTASEEQVFHSESSHDHFEHFYGLFDCPDCSGFPTLGDARSIVSPGLCEPYLECLESLLLWDRLSALKQMESAEERAEVTVLAPHNLSRCDTPTYP